MFEFSKVGCLPFASNDNLVPLIRHVACRKISQRNKGVHVTENAAFVPLHLHPRWITNDQIEAAPLRKQVGKAKLPVVKMVFLGHLIHDSQPLVLLQQFLDIDHAEATDELDMFRIHQLAREKLAQHGSGLRGLDGTLENQLQVEKEDIT